MDKKSETTNCNEPCSAFFPDAIISNLNLIDSKKALYDMRPHHIAFKLSHILTLIFKSSQNCADILFNVDCDYVKNHAIF